MTARRRTWAQALKEAEQIFDDYQFMHAPGEVMQLEPMYERASERLAPGDDFDPLVGVALAYLATERLGLIDDADGKERKAKTMELAQEMARSWHRDMLGTFLIKNQYAKAEIALRRHLDGGQE